MIRNFKIYERDVLSKYTDPPKIGDYVICTEFVRPDQILLNFLSSNIGQIRRISEDYYNPYHIYYENIPEDIGDQFFFNDFREFSINEILEYSENKKDLEHIIAANKYNI